MIALGLFDALVFSGAWIALAAAALVAAASRGLGVPVDTRALGLAFAGSFAVYNIDRLRDLARDRHTAPARTAFVLRHQTLLKAGTLLALLLALLLAVSAGLRAGLLLAPVLLLGLAHRRLKHFSAFKPVYISAAWLAVVVGLPWCLAANSPFPIRPAQVAWGLGILAPSILANAIAANIRDHEAGAARALALARALAAGGVACALVAPEAVRLLIAIPAATWVALAAFRATERYGLAVVDGALLVGALTSLWLPQI